MTATSFFGVEALRKSQSVAASQYFGKLAFIVRFMNNEILPMFVGFVRVLRPFGLPRILHIPAFSVSIVHKIVLENS